MKTTNFFFSLFLFLCFVMYAITELKSCDKEKISAHEKVLQASNDSLFENNLLLDGQLQILQYTINGLQEELRSQKRIITQFKSRAQKKIKEIDSLNSRQLSDYFSAFHTQPSTESQDSLLSFSITDSKTIAKELEKGNYCDSVLTATENEVNVLNQLQVQKDSSIQLLHLKTSNLEQIIDTQKIELNNYDAALKKAEKNMRREKWKKRLLVAGFFILGSFAVLK